MVSDNGGYRRKLPLTQMAIYVADAILGLRVLQLVHELWGNYHICKKRKLKRACVNKQSCQTLHCCYTKKNIDKDKDQI